MTFGQPLWFWVFALFPLLIAVFLRNEMLRARLLRKLVAVRLQDRLAGTVSLGKRRLRFILLLLGGACVVVSLAQPRLGSTWEQKKRKGRDVLIAIDVSKSMLSTDIAPNRLTRAKFAAQDLIVQLQGDRVGLIAFAGSAFLQAPLTADFSAVLNSLNELDTEIIPRGGTDIAQAIRVAVEAFGKGESDNRALIIFTDGEELDEDALKAAEKNRDSLKIFGVGVGTADGSLIPVPGRSGGTEFVKDENGQFVKSRLDVERLRKIAQTTGGFYVHLQSGPAEMKQIVREGLGKMTEKEIDAKLSRQPIERYQWPLAAGLILLASSMVIGERKRGTAWRSSRIPAAALAILVTLAWAGVEAAAAESPLDLYARGQFEEAEQGYQRMVEKNPKSEALAFNWGAAAYKNQDLDTALKAFSQALTTEDAQLRSKAEYNLGNTLFEKGSAKMDRKTLEDALGHYVQALNLVPDDANAKYNKKVTEDLLEKLKQQEQQKQQQPNQDKKDQQQQPDQGKNESKPQEKKEGQENQPKNDQQSQQQKDENGPSQDKKSGQKSESKSGQEQKNEQASGTEGKQEQQSRPHGSKGSEDRKDAAREQKGDGKEARNGSEQPPPPDAGQTQPEKRFSGDVKANRAPDQDQRERQEEAAADELAATEGQMTERQARALLDSLKSEDDRVRLIDPNERKRAGRVLRDW